MAEQIEGRLCQFIRHRRKQLAMTQPQLASMIDVDPDYIALLEAGDRELDHDKINPLADALAVDRTYLCVMTLVEGAPPIARKYFWGPLLADMANGGEA